MVSAVTKRHSDSTIDNDNNQQLFNYTQHMNHLYQQVVRILIVEIFTKAVSHLIDDN